MLTYHCSFFLFFFFHCSFLLKYLKLPWHTQLLDIFGVLVYANVFSSLFLFFLWNNTEILYTSYKSLFYEVFSCLFIPFPSGIPLNLYGFAVWVQFNSVAQSCLTLCNPMNRSMPGLPVHLQLLEFTQTHVCSVSAAIQPSHPLSSPVPPALNLSQHQGLFKWVSSSHQVAKVLEFQLQHQSFHWIFKTDFL